MPTAIVVGGTAGIGRAMARVLAQRGHDVTIVGRPGGAGPQAAAELGARFRAADVSDLDAVRALAGDLGRDHTEIAHLVQTADVIKRGRVLTPQGYEVGFATNYLSRFLLVDLLLPQLRAGRAVVHHVAAAGAAGRLSLEQVPPGPRIGAFLAHGIGQGANDVFGVELAARLAGTGVRVHVSNPGAAATGIRDEVNGTLLGKVLGAVFGTVMTVRAPDEVARILLDAAERHPDDVLIGIKGPPVRIPARARDAALRAALWERSAELVALS